jgi:hypothetical protein
MHVAPACGGSDHFSSYVYNLFLYFHMRLFQIFLFKKKENDKRSFLEKETDAGP